VLSGSQGYTHMNICDVLEKQIDIKHDEVTHSTSRTSEYGKEDIVALDEHFIGEDDRSLTTQQYEVEENGFAAKCEDHEKAPPRDETQEDDQDGNSSPRLGNSLIKWWKTKDSMFSPSKGM